MFSSDKNIDILARLIGNLRKYGELRLEAFQVSTVSKVTIALTALIVGAILFAIVGIVIFFLSLAVLFLLADYVGYAWAAAIVAGAYLLLALMAYSLRQQLFMNPIARLLSSLLLDDKPVVDSEEEEEAFTHCETPSSL
ncbi:MAG: hypothetical protein Q4D66_04050 [Bacteroidales bacterium]|nr:hypothetical protein [Bacteroidales bacterium]